MVNRLGLLPERHRLHWAEQSHSCRSQCMREILLTVNCGCCAKPQHGFLTRGYPVTRNQDSCKKSRTGERRAWILLRNHIETITNNAIISLGLTRVRVRCPLQQLCIGPSYLFLALPFFELVNRVLQTTRQCQPEIKSRYL